MKRKYLLILPALLLFTACGSNSLVSSTITEETTVLSNNDKEIVELTEPEYKDIALNIDKEIANMVRLSEKDVNTILEKSNLVSKEELTVFEMYDIVKSIKDNQENYRSTLNDLKDDLTNKYIESCLAYIDNTEKIANSIIIGINNLNSDDISYGLKLVAETKTLSENIATERLEYLKNSESVNKIMKKKKTENYSKT